ncbi:MAG: FAD-dependent oxidoreductase [Burkholderiaceae bacterium]
MMKRCGCVEPACVVSVVVKGDSPRVWILAYDGLRQAVQWGKAKHMNTTRSAAIVGAGIVGVCTGLELQLRGWAVTLIDRSFAPRFRRCDRKARRCA